MRLGDAVLTMGELCKLTGASSFHVDYLIRLELLEPSVKAPQGPGSRKLFGAKEALVVDIVTNLRPFCQDLERLRPFCEVFARPDFDIDRVEEDDWMDLWNNGLIAGHVAGLDISEDGDDEIDMAISVAYRVKPSPVVERLRRRLVRLHTRTAA